MCGTHTLKKRKFSISQKKRDIMKKEKKKPNKKVILYSILAIICVGLAITIDWIFLLAAVILIWLNQKELIKK